jgi:hypothetical protein
MGEELAWRVCALAIFAKVEDALFARMPWQKCQGLGATRLIHPE